MKQTNVGMVLIALMIGVFMENLDHTIMATAVPSVVAQLGGMDVFSWVFSVYLITSTIFIPVFGKLADQYGKKPFLLIGTITFVIASALSANAETIWQLIAYRALQGLGAAPLMPLAFAMVFEIVKPEKQGHMQGLLGMVNGLSLVLGPIIGAFLTDNFSWHWIFLINIPLGIIATLLIAIFYKEEKVRKEASIDYMGAAMLAAAITPLLFGLTMGGKDYAWGSWQIIGLFALCAVFTYMFIRTEKKAKEPIMALQLFNPKVVSATGVALLQGLVLIAVMVYIPFFIQGVQEGTVTHVGTVLTHMIVAMMLGAGIGGHLLQKHSPRAVILLSVVLMGAGMYLLTQLVTTTSDMYFYISLILIGLGMGPLMPLTTMLAQTSVDHHHTTSATSLVSFFRNIGMALASNLLAVIVNYQVMKSQNGLTSGEGALTAEQIEMVKDPNLLMDSGLHGTIPEQALGVLQSGLATGITQVFAVSIGALVIMAALAFLAGKEKIAHDHGGKKMGFHH